MEKKRKEWKKEVHEAEMKEKKRIKRHERSLQKRGEWIEKRERSGEEAWGRSESRENKERKNKEMR